jgi:hypothetical protein
MRERWLLRDNYARTAWALMSLSLAAFVPAAGYGAERVVLGEEFTATW